MISDEILSELMDEASRAVPFVPSAYYDTDGDCLEFFVCDEPFKAKRLDKWVTVYYGRQSHDVVGSLVKNVRELLHGYPGIDIDIEGEDILLSHMLRGPAYATDDPVKKKEYKAVLVKVDEKRLRAPVREALAGMA